MDKNRIKKALDEVKSQDKRKFTQSLDVIINLKNIIIKSNPVNFFVNLHYSKGKPIKIVAFVDQRLEENAKKVCDLTISEAEFAKYKDKKVAKKLAQEYDFFIAQANLMAKVAQNFGRVLGTRGKMPNPKLGCVVPPNVNLEVLKAKLERTVLLSAKKGTNLQCLVGKEDQNEEEIIDNILTVIQTAVKNLPNEEQNIKSVLLKTTMGKPVKL